MAGLPRADGALLKVPGGEQENAAEQPPWPSTAAAQSHSAYLRAALLVRAACASAGHPRASAQAYLVLAAAARHAARLAQAHHEVAGVTPACRTGGAAARRPLPALHQRVPRDAAGLACAAHLPVLSTLPARGTSDADEHFALVLTSAAPAGVVARNTFGGSDRDGSVARGSDCKGSVTCGTDQNSTELDGCELDCCELDGCELDGCELDGCIASGSAAPACAVQGTHADITAVVTALAEALARAREELGADLGGADVGAGVDDDNDAARELLSASEWYAVYLLHHHWNGRAEPERPHPRTLQPTCPARRSPHVVAP